MKKSSEDLQRQLASLSPQKRALYEKLLADRQRKKAAAQERQLPTMTRREQVETAPLSFAQSRLWVLDRLMGTAAYNISITVELGGDLRVDVLQRALKRVIGRHEALRTTFEEQDGEAIQRIHPHMDVPIEFADLRHLQADPQREALWDRATAVMNASFDLAVGPLMRALLVRLADDRHGFVLTLHHIIADGWSNGVLLKELATLYTAFAEGRDDPLPPLAFQYGDYAAMQRKWLDADEMQRQLAYWKEQLAGELPTIDLPLKQSRRAAQTFAGDHHMVQIQAALHNRLKTLAKAGDATPFMVLLAAFAVLLHRYTHQTDILIGSPIANRTRPELEELIGFFVNLLVFRIDLSGDPDFATILRRVRRTTLEAYENQDTPFEKLVDELDTRRELGVHPLFQVHFAMQNTPQSRWDLSGLEMRWLDVPREVAQFDLTLSLIEDLVGGLVGTLNYNVDLLEGGLVTRMAGQLLQVLDAVAADDRRPLSQLPRMDAEARAKLLVDWNRDQYREYDVTRPLHALVADHGQRNHSALVFNGNTMAYADMETEANRLAHYLRQVGVGPECIVGLCVERSMDLIVATLAILKAGGAYLPLDPDYPPERLQFMLQDSGCDHLLTYSHLEQQFPDFAGERILPDDIYVQAFLEQMPDEVPQVQGLDANTLAYVIYTSGSTGRPKGVALAHRGWVNLVLAQREAFQVKPDSRVLQFASFSFDAAASEWPMALTLGATLVMIDNQTARSPEGLATVVAREGVTHITVPPAILAHLAPDAFASVQVLVVAGEHFTTELADCWSAKRVMINAYGPTEATIGATFHTIQQGEYPLPIGKPFANVNDYVVDRHLKPVPQGVAGELVIGGPGLARGYLGRPALTAAHFVPNPFGEQPGERLYRTKDLVRHLDGSPDMPGPLTFLGRTDHQVKIRGFRVEPGEVESRLAAQDGVRDALVLVREVEGNKRLLAYVTPGDESRPPRESALRETLADGLPDYMVPAAIVVLDAFPLTPNGKVDRNALPEPGSDHTVRDDYVPPRTSTERKLCAIWERALGLAQVGIHDNFFAVGGDSILSIDVVTRANRAGLPLTTQVMFECQTVAELAERLDSEAGTTAGGLAASQEAAQGPQPLLPIMHWFFRTVPMDRHYYNQALLLKIPTTLDEASLRAMVSAVVTRHDALRLAFDESEPSAAFVPLEQLDLDRVVEVVDLPSVDETTWRKALRDHAEQVQQRFNLQEPPLLRTVWFPAVGDFEARLLLVCHHLVVDGVSWRILLGDFHTAWLQIRSGHNPELAPKTSSLQQWAGALAARGERESLDVVQKVWRPMLRQPVPALPVDKSAASPARQDATAYLDLVLDPPRTRQLLHEIHAPYRTRVDEVLLAAVALAFARWSGLDRLPFRMEGHGREPLFDTLDTTQTLGWFTATYPWVFDVSQQADLAGLLCAIKEQRRAVPHGGLDFGIVRDMLAEATLVRLDEALPPALVFNYLGQFDQALEEASAFSPADEPIGAHQAASHPRQHAFAINALVAEDQLRISLDYSRAQYETDTAEAILAEIDRALDDLAAVCLAPDAGRLTPADFPLATMPTHRLDVWQSRYPNLVDIYIATPMQQGLLHHARHGADGAYISQLVLHLAGDLNVAAFRAAWEHLVARHAVLRTVLVGIDTDEPHQLVVDHVDLPWVAYDWQDRADFEADFAAWQAEDRKIGFDYGTAPLLRCALFRDPDHTWRLVWTHHHVLLDGWCQPILLGEVMVLYRALSQSLRPNLPEPPNYRDYIAWLAKQPSGEGYWRDTLADYTGGFVLPHGQPDHAGHSRSVSLPASITEALKQRVGAAHVTLNTAVQSAWSLLLAIFAQRRDVVFGETVSGRPAELPHAAEMVGLFINTLPVRVNAPASGSIAQWWREMHAAAIERNRYAHAPLIDILGWSSLSRGSDLFDTLVVFENYPVTAAEAAGSPQERGVSLMDMAAIERTHYALTLTAMPGESLKLRLDVDTQRYGAADAEHLLDHLCHVLTQMTHSEDVADLSIWSPAARYRVLEAVQGESNPPAVPLAKDKIASMMVDSHDQPAISMRGRDWRYGELQAAVAGWAHHYRHRGLKPGAMIGLNLPMGLDFVAAFLACWYEGLVAIPLNGSVPTARFDSMTAALDMVVDAGCQIPAELTPASGRPLRTDMPAYGLYTSGTTGQPKLVLVSHGALSRYLLWARDAYAMRGPRLAGAVVATAPYFDATLTALLLPLLTGKTVHCLANGVDHADHLITDLCHMLCADGRPWLFKLTPSHLAAADHVAEPVVSTMAHVLVIGGETLSMDLVHRWRQRLPKARFVNEYGPTETVVGVTGHVVPATDDATAPIPADQPAIGRARAGLRLLVVDAQLDLLPDGVEGELLIGCLDWDDALAIGYDRRPRETAQAFVPDPYAGRKGARAYRSGDRVWRDASGDLHFVGRVDEQVKVRGLRLEPGEVTAVLMRHEQVQRAITVVRHDGEQPVWDSYFEGSASTTTLSTWLAQYLPTELLPRHLLPVDDWPLTPNGKLDRNALPLPADKAPQSSPSGSLQGAVSFLENQLRELWQDVLAREVAPTERDVDFFALGGHSLRAARLSARVRDQLGLDLPLAVLFRKRTLQEQVRYLQEKDVSQRQGRGPVAVPRDQPLPLSPAQQRMWFLDRLAEGDAAYHIPLALHLRGWLDPLALAASLRSVRERHGILRTRFLLAAGEPRQVEQAGGEPDWVWIDLRGLQGKRRQRLRSQLVSREAGVRFDLQRQDPWRVRLLQLADNDQLLLTTMHHIASDAWSSDIFIGEILAGYEAALQGRSAALPPLSLQVADVATWQRKRLDDPATQARFEDYAAQLTGAPTVHDLPLDGERGEANPQRAAGWVREQVPQHVLDRLQPLLEQEGATLYTALLASFVSLLFRLGAGEDLVLGTPVDSRDVPAIEPLIGLFANTLVLRQHVTGQQSFRKVLAASRDQILYAFNHRDVPFEWLVERIQPERDPTISPLFQVMFAYQHATAVETRRVTGLQLVPASAGTPPARFELSLNAVVGEQGVDLDWEYRADLFDQETVARWAKWYTRMLRAVAAAPDIPIVDLALLDGKDRERLRLWNKTDHISWPWTSVVAAVDATTAAVPDRIAVSDGWHQLTYAGFQGASRAGARMLRQRGVGAEQRVALVLARSLQRVVALWSVWRAGAAYVPLDRDLPDAQLAWMLSDCQPALVWTDTPQRLAGLVEGLNVEQPPARWLGDDGRLPIPCAEQSAYLIFTSGSTGRPKAVMSCHGPLLNRIAWMQAALDLDAGDVVAQKTPYSFDVSVWEFSWPFQAGARLAVVPPDLHREPAPLAAFMQRQAVSTLHFVPSMLTAMTASAAWRHCTSVRQVICSGEALPAALLDPDLHPYGTVLINLYGPTEAAIDVSSFLPILDPSPRNVPIGRPIFNVELHVVDASGRPVLPGAAGELWIGGVAPARGYWQRPGLTAERFVPDDLGRKPGARLYRTGDRVRLHHAERLLFLGRFDFQVKLRGFRIELGAVEQALRTLDDVADAAVLLHGSGVDAQLCGYVVSEREPDDLRQALGALLPSYMVPAVIMCMAALPLTANGKLDRKALPSPRSQVRARVTELPATEREARILAVFRQVLHQPEMGVTDDFFAMGGHSLAGVRLLDRLRADLGVDLPLNALFQRPTVRGLAQCQQRDDAHRPPTLTPRKLTQHPPLSYAQQRLWVLERLGEGGIAYHLPAHRLIQGPLAVQALEAALGHLLQRHEILRTLYRLSDDQPYQHILPYTGWDITVIDGAHLTPAQCDHLIARHSRRVFDLAKEWPLRCALLRLAPDRHILALTFHHIAVDGTSLNILATELADAYMAALQRRDGPTQPRLQFADVAVWERTWLQGAVLEKQLDYWRNLLQGAPWLHDLPLDRPRPARRSGAGQTAVFALQADLVDRATSLAQAQGVSRFSLMLAAFVSLLHRVGGGDDWLIGTPVDNRRGADMQAMPGLLINTLVLRTQLQPQQSFQALVQQAGNRVLGALSHRFVPFDLLVDSLRPPRDLATTPLFQIMFSFHEPAVVPAPSGQQWRPLIEGHSGAQFDLSLTMAPSDGGWDLAWEYSTDIFDEATITTLSQRFERWLDTVLGDSECPMRQLSLLTAAEKRELLAEPPAWATGAQLPAHLACQTWAMREPDRCAVMAEGVVVTYGALLERAERLATHLCQQGVRAGDRVGILCGHQAELPLAVLACLGVGATYVPLDPNYPAQRLAHMVADSGLRVLLVAEPHRDRVPPSDVLCVVNMAVASGSVEPTGLVQTVSDHAGAYLLYTSGSTGAAKGVLVSHGALREYVAAVQTQYALAPGDGVLQYASFSFDICVEELFVSWFVGGRLIPRNDALVTGDGAFWAFARRHAVNALCIPTAFWHAICDGLNAERGRWASQLLRTCSFGGEALSAARLSQWHRYVGDQVRLINSYGPTEATVVATVANLSQPRDDGQAPIGRALPHARTFIVDVALQLTPPGVPGELLLGGHSLAQGYIGRPAQTASQFVPDPYSDVAGARLYRTGDRVRQLRDGQYVYLGRLDRQVKVRGFRVEPGEIASHLLALDHILDAVVIPMDRDGQTQLAAYYVPNEPVDSASLRQYLAERLPNYMVPASYTLLSAMPKTPNNKLDLAALPDPDPVVETYQPPRNEMERLLCDLWQSIMGVARVGIDDNFFALGGDSIAAVQLVNRAQRIGLHFQTGDVFQHQTVRALAERARLTEAQPRQVAKVRDTWPLLPIQHKFLAHPGEDAHHFNQALLLTVPASLDELFFRDFVAALLVAHPILRLRFDFLHQTAQVQPLDQIPVSDLVLWETVADRTKLEARAAAIQTTLDPAQGRLLRVARFTPPAGGDARLLLVIHHLVVDGVSWRILARQLDRALAQHAAGTAIQLEAETTTQADWAEQLNALVQQAVFTSQHGFWLDQLPAGRVAGFLNIEPGMQPGHQADVIHVHRTWSRSQTKRLVDDATRAYRATIDELLLAALTMAHERFTHDRGLRLDCEHHGRIGDMDLGGSLGWFTSLYPLFIAPDPMGAELDSDCPAVFVARVKARLRRVPDHGVGFGAMWSTDSDLQRAAAASPAELVFNYLGTTQTGETQSGRIGVAPESAGPTVGPGQPRWYAVEWNAVLHDQCLQTDVSLDGSLCERATLDAFLSCFDKALDELVSAPVPRGWSAHPTDFPHADISTSDLRRLLRQYPPPVDLYNVTPMQAGMLFHATHEAHDPYVTQTRADLYGALDVSRFRNAWVQVLQRHAVFRTAFVAQDDGEGWLQWVWPSVALPWQEAAQVGDLDAFAVGQRDEPFDLTQPPAMRIALVRCATDHHHIIWTHHHLLVDGWCLPVVFDEVMRLYHQPEVLEQLPVPGRYRDYVAWLQAQPDDAAETYWRDLLADCDEPATLGPQNLPGEALDGDGQSQAELSAELSRALEALARQHQVTPHVVLQTAWSLVLMGLTARRDVIFGVTLSGRPGELPGVETTVGLFINTVPARVRWSQQTKLTDCLRSIHDATMARERHGYEPLHKIQRWSPLPANQPLFDSLFVFENYPVDQSLAGTAQATGLRVERVDHYERTHYALTLSAAPGPRWPIKLTYDASRIAAATAERVIQRLEYVLAELVRDDQRRLDQVPLMPFSEQQRVLQTLQGDAADSVPAVSLPQRIAARTQAAAEAGSDDVMIRWGKASWSSQELVVAALHWANELTGAGVQPGDVVAVIDGRTPTWVVAQLACWYSGAVYLPLDPQWPTDRCAWILDDAGVDHCLVGADIHEVISLPTQVTTHVLTTAGLAMPTASEPQVVAPRQATIPQAAYLIYTSGSTGTPKGVLVGHGHLAATLNGAETAFAPRAQDVGACIASVAFDISLFELWLAPLAGGSCRLVSRATLLDPTAIGEDLADVTVLHAVPGLLEAWLDTWSDAVDGPCPRLVFTGGDRVPPALLRRAQAHWPQASIYELYGPTEGTIIATRLDLAAAPDYGSATVIGGALPQTQVQVLAAGGSLCDWGVPGEITLGGQSPALGYWRQPGQTAARFVPDAHSGRAGARCYRTGDRGMLLPSGDVVYLGRLDRQVKLRGFRVELGEIEARLEAMTDVREAAVLLLPAQAGQPARLAACLAAAEDARYQDILAAQVPAYMVPSTWHYFDTLPRTTAGKLDRRRLAALLAQHVDQPATQPAREPLSESDQAMLAVWRDVLQQPDLGVKDDFFQVGGDSITAIRLVAQMRRQGFAVNTRDLFAQPNVAALTTAVVQGDATATAVAAPGPVPLLPVQAQFLRDQANRHFNQSLLLNVPTDLSGEALVAVAQHLTAHHENLRLHFQHHDGAWQAQLLADDAVDAAAMVVVEPLPDANDLASRLAHWQAAFQLDSWPLFRMVLFQSERGSKLLITAHHLVVDIASWPRLLGDLRRAYEVEQTQSQPQLEPVIGVATWARRLSQAHDAGAFNDEQAFWLGVLRDDLPLPQKHRAADGTPATVAREVLTFDADFAQRLLDRTAPAARMLPGHLVLSFVAQALAQWSSQDAVRIEMESFGRQTDLAGCDQSDGPGWFTATYPLVLSAMNEAATSARLRAIKQALAAVPHEGVGFGWLLESDDDLQAGAAAHPPWVTYNFTRAASESSTGEDQGTPFRVAPESPGPEVADDWLPHRAVMVEAECSRQTGVQISLVYRTDRVTTASMAELAANITACGHALVADWSGLPAPLTLAEACLTADDEPFLQQLLAQQPSLVDAHVATPMQQTMLLHGLTGDTAYITQLHLDFTGDFDGDRFRAAWAATVAANPVFRAAFAGLERGTPVQWVAATAEVPWIEEVWDGEAASFQRYLETDRARGLDVTQPPLMRCHLLRQDRGRVRFLWTHHHALLDGWSLPLVFQEVMTRYQAEDVEQPTFERAPFANYARWLAPRKAAGASYWRAALAGIDEPTPLGLDVLPPQAPHVGYGECVHHLSAAEWEPLAAAARTQRITPSTLLQAAWALMLQHYSGIDDVVFGTTLSGRPAELPGVDTMIGLFINTVPVRVRVQQQDTVGTLLTRMQNDALTREGYAFTALREIHGWSDVPNQLPLFNSLAVYENYPLERGVAGGDDTQTASLQMENLTALDRANVPLTLTAMPGDGLTLRLGYDAEQFDGDRVAKVLTQCHRVFSQLLQAWDRPVTELALLSNAEREQLLKAAEAGTIPAASAYPSDVHQRFAAMVANYPDAVAVVCGTRQHSYASLASMVDRVARQLQGAGVRWGHRVGVWRRSDVELPAVLLACARLGAAFVPLDPSYPLSRLRDMAQDAGLTCVCHTDPAWQPPSLDVSSLIVSGKRESLVGVSLPANPACANQSLYWMFTSGSTGRPKATAVTHSAVLRLVVDPDFLDLGPHTVTWQGAPLSFDAATLEIWAPLLNGGRLVMPGGFDLDPFQLTAQLRTWAVNTLWLTASLFERWVDQQQGPTGLRFLLAGGDVVPPDAVAKLYAVDDQVRFINGYGPTENTTFTCCHAVERDDMPEGAVPIGRGIRGTRVVVLDQHLRLVPPGVPGELCATGLGLAQAYPGRPAETALRFVPNAHFDAAGERLYRTGDRVVWHPNGSLMFLGRMDLQVKLRGYRIEPGEIEACLRTCEGVQAAAVVARGTAVPGTAVPGTADKLLLACYQGTADPDQVREHLRQRLPDYMRPQRIVQLDALPLGETGKLDRRWLATMPLDEDGVAVGGTPPTSALEEELLAYWRDTLQLAVPGVTNNFFDCGGHSLTATRLVAFLRQRFELDLALRTVFENPTVRSLATYLDDLLAVRDSASAFDDDSDMDVIEL